MDDAPDGVFEPSLGGMVGERVRQALHIGLMNEAFLHILTSIHTIWVSPSFACVILGMALPLLVAYFHAGLFDGDWWKEFISGKRRSDDSASSHALLLHVCQMTLWGGLLLASRISLDVLGLIAWWSVPLCVALSVVCLGIAGVLLYRRREFSGCISSASAIGSGIAVLSGYLVAVCAGDAAALGVAGRTAHPASRNPPLRGSIF